MSNDVPEADGWRDRLESAADSSGGCAELWEASEAARREDRQLTRRKLLGSLGTVGALGLAGCQTFGPIRSQTETPVPDTESVGQTPREETTTPAATAIPEETESTPTESSETETETATPKEIELANLLVYKYAETDTASFEVQFIPVVNEASIVANLELASENLRKKQDKRELVNSHAEHELQATRNLISLYPSGNSDDPVMHLKLEQIERLRNLMCKHEADIWGAYVQPGKWKGEKGQFLLVAHPAVSLEFPCTKQDTREWIAHIYETHQSEKVGGAPILQGGIYWAPEWKVACTFVGSHGNYADDTEEEQKLRRDIALYGKLNDKQAAFTNRTRFYEGPNADMMSGDISMTARGASAPFSRSGSWRIDAVICNQVYEAGPILNSPVGCKGKAWSKPVIHEEYPDAYMRNKLITSLGQQLVARYRAYADADNVKPCDRMCQESFEVADCLITANYFFWKEREWDGSDSGTFCGSLSDIPQYLDQGQKLDKLWEGRCGDWSTALVNWCKKRSFDCWSVETHFAVGKNEDHQVVLITPRDVDAKVDSVTRDEFGMVYDAWRFEGKPFWIPPQKDDEWDWGIGD